MLIVEPHPLSEPLILEVCFDTHIGGLTSPAQLLATLSLGSEAPMHSSDEVRLKVRDLLRHGGFKPTGRSKPASEYLIKAATKGFLSSINLPVDVCNVVSLHSGLPISVIDLDRATPPYRIGLAAPDAAYVFNASGQQIDIGGLLCLHDADGPCANAVKDSQRTKTHGETTRCLYVIWGTSDLPGRTEATAAWLTTLLKGSATRINRHSGRSA